MNEYGFEWLEIEVPEWATAEISDYGINDCVELADIALNKCSAETLTFCIKECPLRKSVECRDLLVELMAKSILRLEDQHRQRDWEECQRIDEESGWND